MAKNITVALTGNPNSGKTSSFNALTGLNHKVGNFPGVTVDKKIGFYKRGINNQISVLDLPGTYSLYPKSNDEIVAYEAIFSATEKVDVIVVVLDASNLRRSLFYTSQVLDLQLPVVIALTMSDTLEKQGKAINIPRLEQVLGAPVVAINPRRNTGIEELKKKIDTVHSKQLFPSNKIYTIPEQEATSLKIKQSAFFSDYFLLHERIREEKKKENTKLSKEIIKVQSDEVVKRYKWVDSVLLDTEQSIYTNSSKEEKKLFTDTLDKILLHRVGGVLIMLFVLFLVFQSLFWLASFPMDMIDSGMAALGDMITNNVADTWWRDLLVNGILAGISGIVIFVPQIAILFLLITLLEDSGYMARISFIMDRLFQSSGLSGKSVMPLMSGMACAIPAVMAARTIEDRKQRIITALVTPFMSCSARLPVYTILISLIIPNKFFFGFISYQGLVLMGMYFLGFFMALIVSRILSWTMYQSEKSFFIMELPVYQVPRWKNGFITMIEKAKIFIIEAGKVILIISVILWVLTSYGPTSRMEQVHAQYKQIEATQNEPLDDEHSLAYSAALLENSYAGIIGKAIEPVIKPLGYDWKIGIALITSFAAREVFVGTMATLYAASEDEGDNNLTLRKKMASAKRSDGTPVYTFATGISLLLFYAFAMQCMSTVAIVRRELGGWRLAIFQLIMMTGIAYLLAFIAFQLLK